MRHISFALTTKQFLDGTKDVTRRIGWAGLKPGTRLMAIEKGQGLKKGEKVRKLGEIEVVGVRQEPLSYMLIYQPLPGYGHNEVAREGFPDMTPVQFVKMFRTHTKCEFHRLVTRIEFRRIGANV